MPARALGYLLLCNALGGASYAAMAWTLRGFSSPAAVFWRLLLGGLLFIPVARAEWRRTAIGRGDWLRIAAVGVFGLALPLTLGAMGMRRSSATNAALLVGLEPVSILVLSALFLRENLSLPKVGAIALGLIGSSFIALQGPPWRANVTPHWRGDVLLMTHAACWSLYSIIGKSALRRVPATLFTALTTAVAIVPAGLAAGASLWPGAVPRVSLVALAFQAVGVTYGATLLWNKALELIPASTIANFVFLQPVTGAAIAVLAGEGALTGWSTAGGALIVAGVTLASR